MLNGTEFQSTLLPRIFDIEQVICFSLVAMLTCGIGFLAGARRPETALFSGWGASCIVFVIAGCLFQSSLIPIAAMLAMLGLVGLVLRASRWKNVQCSSALHVFLLGTPLLLILISFRTTAYDDFAFWAPNLVALCETGHFPVAAHPLVASFMPAYPRAVALSGFATFLLTPSADPANIVRLLSIGPWWNVLLMLSAASALAYNVEQRIKRHECALNNVAQWGIAGLAVLLQTFLDPGFIPKMTLSNMGDAASASGFAFLVALLFELFDAKRDISKIIIEIALTASAVIFVRQDNLALLFVLLFSCAVNIVFWSHTQKVKQLSWLLIASMPALIVGLVWARYAASQIPGPHHSLLPFNEWHWSDFGYTLHSAARVFLAKGVYTLMALGFGIAFVLLLSGKLHVEEPEKRLLTIVTGFVFGNAAFIMFAYLATNFGQYDVRTAVTFWRFLAQTAPAEMVALACLVPITFFAPLLSCKYSCGIAGIAALIPVLILPTKYTFRYDLNSPVPEFLALGQSIGSSLPKGASVLLLDNSDGSGYAAWLVKFGMLELAHGHQQVAISFAPQDPSHQPLNMAALHDGSYVFITQGKSEVPYFKQPILRPWHAYLFGYSRGSLKLQTEWPIPAYGKK